MAPAKETLLHQLLGCFSRKDGLVDIIVEAFFPVPPREFLSLAFSPLKRPRQKGASLLPKGWRRRGAGGKTQPDTLCAGTARSRMGKE